MLCTVQCRPAAACARKSPPRVHSKETRQDKTRYLERRGEGERLERIVFSTQFMVEDGHTVIQRIHPQCNALTRLVEPFFISVPGKVSKIKPKISLSLACRSLNLSMIDWCGGSQRKEKAFAELCFANFGKQSKLEQTRNSR